MAPRVLIVVLLALAATKTSLAEQVTFEPCPQPESDIEDPSSSPPVYMFNCTVHDVFITPCAEAAQDLPCRIKRGRSASIQFDFTPEVALEKVKSRAYWVTAGPMGDLPFVGMNSDACQNTECPLQVNTKQQYTYDLPISKLFPLGKKTHELPRGHEQPGYSNVYKDVPAKSSDVLSESEEAESAHEPVVTHAQCPDAQSTRAQQGGS